MSESTTPEPDLLETVARFAAEAALAAAPPAPPCNCPPLPDYRPALERLAARITDLEGRPASPEYGPALERLAARITDLEGRPAATCPDWAAAITALEHAVADLKLTELERKAP